VSLDLCRHPVFAFLLFNFSLIQEPQLGKARFDGSAGSIECFCQLNDG
jgi:hypothetical protein